VYEEIPHLMTRRRRPKQAANALRWAGDEMEARYKTLAAEGVRNIEQYNRNVHTRSSRSGRQKTARSPSRFRSSSW